MDVILDRKYVFLNVYIIIIIIIVFCHQMPDLDHNSPPFEVFFLAFSVTLWC